MFKNKLFLLALATVLVTGCLSISSVSNYFSSETPTAIQEAVASRVNPESELYVLSSASLSKSGSIVAQSQANKDASSALRSQIKKKWMLLYKGYLEIWMHFLSLLYPVRSDLSTYSTDLIMKKLLKKELGKINRMIYSLLSVDKSEINNISQKFLKIL